MFSLSTFAIFPSQNTIICVYINLSMYTLYHFIYMFITLTINNDMCPNHSFGCVGTKRITIQDNLLNAHFIFEQKCLFTCDVSISAANTATYCLLFLLQNFSSGLLFWVIFSIQCTSPWDLHTAHLCSQFSERSEVNAFLQQLPQGHCAVGAH